MNDLLESLRVVEPTPLEQMAQRWASTKGLWRNRWYPASAGEIQSALRQYRRVADEQDVFDAARDHSGWAARCWEPEDAPRLDPQA